ncbi:hypothetical protein [Shinella sp.]|uniref:hypothetical protein n=1 Tax=Shinella sp. TaxID=1870904 RepID=UPI0028A9823D|nr:hypothetical protein [Shinella sp.]
MNIAPTKNAFQKALEAEYDDDYRLGMPSRDVVHQSRRLNAMSQMTGGNGFPTPAKATRVFADGTTRGDRKRKARAATNARVSENRDAQFMHSAARVRAGAVASMGIAA